MIPIRNLPCLAISIRAPSGCLIADPRNIARNLIQLRRHEVQKNVGAAPEQPITIMPEKD
jgi:hypothetical protein